MFRLAMGITFVFLIWLQSLFTQTVHAVQGDTHIFKYNWVPWFFLVLMFFTLIGFAEIARRFLKDRIAAVICLLGIPLFALIPIPQR